ncbi:hypothetical protein ABZW18_28190 [Streptomyces sp. NPDC004647]|uniref:hypothetical protein n=1 Tax=Streptomyces sp. NPDC004647 TaxID=3154671 RepID=UPI0033A2E05B
MSDQEVRSSSCSADGPNPMPPADAVTGPPYADCVLCGEPTEYGAAQPGATLCPVCEWQEAQRTACSG